MSLKLVKSTGVQVARFDIGLDDNLSGDFECPQCKDVVNFSDLRFSFRLVEGFKTSVYRIKSLCLRCRDSGV